ncbi:MAG TPA: formimidoylglutamate deiminase [Thermomicrobiales bacterium]|nr:formimidoylglutamate deiminase [Thermomicrobiales bacterium]
MSDRQYLRAAHLHQPDGWLSPGFLEIDGDGTISQVTATMPAEWDATEVQRLDGYVLPGMLNLHSHAHQRGLAGRAEGGSGATEAENFWSWRERMYAFLLSLTPDDFEAIAAQLYLEMLRAGFTTVGEFHYLHHDRDGGYYADPHEMSARLLAAADQTGIALTMLPSLYTHAGIGRPATPEQRRFVHRSVDDFLALFEWLRTEMPNRPLLRVGVAPHSLRAVSGEELSAVVASVSGLPDVPIHLHVAEQTGEVEEIVTRLGTTPASWLFANQPVNDRWTFIHATHCTLDELRELAGRGAVVGLCPTTEGNLGDGLFQLRDYAAAGGRWGIGTDANLQPDPGLELRFLEYGQRLFSQRRSILVEPGATTAQPGRRLHDLALAGGAQALAQPAAALTAGRRADLVELDPDHPAIVAQQPASVLDGWLVAGSRELVRTVLVGGTWLVRDGHHQHEETITDRYRAVMRRLAGAALSS